MGSEMKMEEEFKLEELQPKFVINSKGIKKPFEEVNIIKSIIRETGLNQTIAEEIVGNVLRKVITRGLDTVSTDFLRELISFELIEKGFYKQKNLFSNSRFFNGEFKLNKSFIKRFTLRNPKWGTLGYITYKRTYARYLEHEDRKEEFWETIQRVVEGCYTIQKEHCLKLGLHWDDRKAQKSAQEMYKKIWDFKFLPPGRGLWMMGTDFVKRYGSMSLNNCAFCSTENIDYVYSRPFEFVMDCLMLGVGVGFDTKGSKKLIIKEPLEGMFDFHIPDSREGWIEALKLVLDAYFIGKQIPTLDFSLIRPAGAIIHGFGGIASGPKPLEDMLIEIKKILKDKIGKKLTSVDIVDIMNNIGKCVIAGNVRRSAEIALGDYYDKKFILCKQDKEKLYSHRWVSNNTIIAKKGMDYSFVEKQIVVNGEPGIFWIENARKYSRMNGKIDYKDKKVAGINPCGEQSLESYELCCLVETFPSNHKNYEEFRETLKYAYLYTKSVTLLNTHWKETNAIMLKNRRMGISQSGIIEAFVKHGRRKILNWCDNAYNYLRKLDEVYSDWLCIPRSIKITTVKPSGTVSLLPGVSAGIHYPHSEYYIRRIRIADNSELIDDLRKQGYKIEKDVYSKNTLVVEFPVHEENFERSKEDVSIWEQAENAADYQKYWSDNQVSITITFKPEEANQIKYLLECYEDKLKSVSFLPSETHGYEQVPYEKITKKQYEEAVEKTNI